MRVSRFGIAAVVLLACLVFSVNAALPPRSPEELEEGATLIVTGTVSEIKVASQGSGNHVDSVFKLQATVETVEKGDGAQSGDTIDIRCWTIKRRPSGWAGPSGHHSIPAKGSRFRMWLGPVEDGGWEPLQPNGIELLDGSKSYADVQPDDQPDEEVARARWVGIALVIVAAIALCFTFGSKFRRK